MPVDQCSALNLEGIERYPWAVCPDGLGYRGPSPGLLSSWQKQGDFAA